MKKKLDIYDQMHAQKKARNVDNGRKRHKCSICGRVRYERFMQPITWKAYYSEDPIAYKTRYGNVCYVCVDNPDCEHESKWFRPY